MAASDFFARWSKAAPVSGAVPVGPSGDPALPAAVDTAAPAAPPPRTLTLDDAAALTANADFKPFMASNVDAGVKRLALKQLFADPRFNVMDGLDTYIEDYNRFVPMDAVMVAALNHGKALLDPLAHLLRSNTVAAPPAPAQPEPDTHAASSIDAARSSQTEAQSAALIASPCPIATAAPAALDLPTPGIHDKSLPGL